LVGKVFTRKTWVLPTLVSFTSVRMMEADETPTHNPDLKAFADRLKARGKNIFAVITVTLRKLLILANTLIAENRTWTPEKP
jgi:hypothetical protein